MSCRKSLLLAFAAILILTSCTQSPSVTPTPAIYIPEGTPGVKPKVEIILPDPIPCEKVSDESCKYNYRIKFQEINGASVFISAICLSYTDIDNKVYTQGGLDGCFDTNIVIPPGGTMEYDKEKWLMGGGFFGGKLNVKANIRFKFEQSSYYEYAVKSVQLAWPSWATRTPKVTPSP